MRVGLLVDGKGERDGLPYLRDRFPHDIVIAPILLCKFHPEAPPGHIARVVASDINILLAKPPQPDAIVVLVDRERRPDCPGAIAADLAARIRKQFASDGHAVAIEVVVKDQQFENWLIADLDALREQQARFRVPDGLAWDGNADQMVKPEELLKRWCDRKRAYRKVDDAVAICQHLDPRRAALHSRLFRRFLRVIGHPLYRDQSQRPAR